MHHLFDFSTGKTILLLLTALSMSQFVLMVDWGKFGFGTSNRSLAKNCTIWSIRFTILFYIAKLGITILIICLLAT
jgi:hypothetical protein